jgi:hypothetical protein
MHFLPRVLIALAITYCPLLLPKLFFVLAISFTYYAVLATASPPAAAADYLATFLLSIMCTPGTLLASLLWLTAATQLWHLTC